MSLSVVRWEPTDSRPLAPLRERWRQASARSGWAYPGDWWVPAVDAVAEVVLDGRDTDGAGERLGRARADAGVGMAEALDDVLALCAVADPPDAVTAGLLRAVAVGWAEQTPVPTLGAPCEDPLTRLVTPDYLRTRMAEVYRESERRGRSVAERYALVVVDVTTGPPDPVRAPSAGSSESAGPSGSSGSSAGGAQGGAGGRVRALTRWVDEVRMVLVAESLRATFSGGETLAGFGTGRAVACVRRDEALGGRIRVLRELLDRDRGVDVDRLAVPRVWVESLPDSQASAMALLDELGR